jgi:hypothetical protein
MGAPYDVGFFETIVNVHFGNIYLLVKVTGENSSFSAGPYPPAPSISVPALSASANRDSVKLLDTVAPASGNAVINGFLDCFNFLEGADPVAAWIAVEGGFGFVPANNNTCDVPAEGLATVPINFVSSASVSRFYLYSIPAGDDLVTINMEGIAAHFDSGITAGFGQTTITGFGSILLFVYSTVKGRITKVTQLFDVFADGKPRPTQDDLYTAGVGSGGGSFAVNVTLDKDKADAQIDNFGKTFQPYKVTLTPNIGGDHIPSQPPPRLG